MQSSPIGSARWLERDESGQLVLTDQQGVRHAGVEPVRNFPISDPDHWISICNAAGGEIMVVADLAAIDSVSRDLLEGELARREFVPAIQAILGVPADTEPSEWEVQTDRGTTRFLLNSDEDVRRLGPHRALLIDSSGIRYLIDDVRTLDPASRRIVEHYLPQASGGK